ncbi:MAG: DUF2029 domain-containing protein [Acidobacteria bacterium]|nr:DUF2029 domain-containing protein [Acidobacteriota bacterium]
MAAAAAFLAVLVWVQRDSLLTGADNDFRALYLAAQAEDAGRLGPEAALHPPAWRWLIEPATWLPYPAASLLWLILSLWAAVCFVGFWRPSAPSTNLLAVATSVPLLFALQQGRETPFLLAAAAMSAWAVRRNKDFAAGLFLSLGALAPQLFLTLPLVALAQRRRRLTAGLATGVACWLAACRLAGPADWPLRWWQAAALRMAAAAPGGEPTLRSTALLGGGGDEAALVACLAAAGIVAVTAARVSYPFALGVALAAGLLTSPFATAVDAALLLPGALAALALARSWSLRASAVVLMAPPLFVLGVPGVPLAVVGAVTAFLLLSLAESLAGPRPDARTA